MNKESAYTLKETNLPQQNYFLSIEDFDPRKSHQIQKYNGGEIVTRKNFLPFFVDTFAKSKGNGYVQLAYFEWLRLHKCFDYEKTLENFIKAGGTNILSQEEVDFFIKSYKSVKTHRNEHPPIEFLDEREEKEHMIKLFDLAIEKFVKIDKTNISPLFSLNELKEMSWQQFMKAINQRPSKKTGIPKSKK